MKKRYAITKLINNNIVFSVDEVGKEIILFGKAIGFAKKKGDVVSESQIIKKFEITDSKQKTYLIDLVEDIQPLYIDLASDIVSLFEQRLHLKINAMMNISLSDHISNAISSKREGLELGLDIQPNIKSIYPGEFGLAEEALEMIAKKTGVELNEYEAGYIVLHYINAQGSSYSGDPKFQLLFQDKVISDIEENLACNLDRTSLYYDRFITHLSYLAARIHDDTFSLDDNDDTLYKTLFSDNDRIKKITEKCVRTIERELLVHINNEEKGYLAVHINNMIKSLERRRSNGLDHR